MKRRFLSLRSLSPVLKPGLALVTFGVLPALFGSFARAAAPCNSKLIQLREVESGKQAKFRLTCESRGGRNALVRIEGPSGTNWLESSIVESAGKGESWREFEISLGKASVEERVLGEFTVELPSGEQKLVLVQPRDEALAKKDLELERRARELEEAKRRLTQENQKLETEVEKLRKKQGPKDRLSVRLGAGVGQCSIAAPDLTSVSGIQPYLGIWLRSPQLFWGVHAFGSAIFAIPQALSGTKQSFNQEQVGLSAPMTFGSVTFEPQLSLLTFGHDEASQGVSFRHTQSAIGATLRAKGAGPWLNIQMSGVAPAGDSSMMIVGAGWDFMSKRPWGIGGFYQKSQYQPNQTDFGQMLGSFFLYF
jgi:hypothetical protein